MKKYVFRPYSPLFPELFLKEKTRIASEKQEYAEIKEQSALDANGEGEKYRNLKEPFIDKIKNILKF